jgi:hypothetical protein
VLSLVLLSRLVCVCCCNFVSCVCFYSHLLLWFIWYQLCKAWETPKCGDSSQWEKLEIRKRTVVLKFDRWITWERLSATLIHWDATTWSRQAFYAWPNHEIKIVVHLSTLLYCDSILSNTSLHLMYCSKFNTHLVRATKWRSHLLSLFIRTWFLVSIIQL